LPSGLCLLQVLRGDHAEGESDRGKVLGEGVGTAATFWRIASCPSTNLCVTGAGRSGRECSTPVIGRTSPPSVYCSCSDRSSTVRRLSSARRTRGSGPE